MTESQFGKTSTRLPLWWLWITLSLAAVILGTWIRLSAPGWLLLFLGVILLAFMVIHPVVQTIAVLRGGRHRIAIPILLLLSDIFFVLSFAFQMDWSDAPGSYMALTAFYYQVLLRADSAPAVSPAQEGLFLALALAFSAALVLSWVLLLLLSRRPPAEKKPEQQPAPAE